MLTFMKTPICNMITECFYAMKDLLSALANWPVIHQPLSNEVPFNFSVLSKTNAYQCNGNVYGIMHEPYH